MLIAEMNMLTECPYCNDNEGFPIQLEWDNGWFCPVCGEEFE